MILTKYTTTITIICDRCGNRDVDPPELNSGVRLLDQPSGTPMDFCPTCSHAFEKWLGKRVGEIVLRQTAGDAA